MVDKTLRMMVKVGPILISVLATVITMTFIFGVNYQTLAAGVESNRLEIAEVKLESLKRNESFKVELKEFQQKINSLSESVARIESSQGSQARGITAIRDDLRSIRQLMEQRR